MPAHFSKSAVRRQDFLDIRQVMDSGDEKSQTPFQKYCDTRWLARGKVMKGIYKNWDSLDAYFTAIKDKVPIESRVDITTLLKILKDRSKLALLAFLIPIVGEFERINTMFQGTTGAEDAYSALSRFHKSLQRRVRSSGPSGEKLPMKEVDFGIDFQQKILAFTRGPGDATELAAKAEDTRQRCWGFLLRVLEEVEKRLPANMAVFQQMSFFSPRQIISGRPPKFADMPFIECIAEHEDLSELEEQWRQVAQVEWAKAVPFKASGEVPTDPVAFWSGVWEFTAGEVSDHKIPPSKLKI